MKRIGLTILFLAALLMALPAPASARHFRRSHRFHHFAHRTFFEFGFGVPLVCAPGYYYVPPPGYYEPPPGPYESPAGRWEWRCDAPGSFCQWVWVPSD